MDFKLIENFTNEETDDFYEELISCTWCATCSDGSYRCHYFFANGTCSRSSSEGCYTQSSCNPATYGGIACNCGVGVFGCEHTEGYNLCISAAFSRYCV